MERQGFFYGHGLPYVDVSDLPGKLIVIEGTDGVGRSTQIENLTEWLEIKGYGVTNTGWTRSPLLGPAIDQIKRGNTLNQITFSVLYAADFSDRLENQMKKRTHMKHFLYCCPVPLPATIFRDKTSMPRRDPVASQNSRVVGG